ncbi:MAG TPA: ATP-binding SpoIIE family protein phosphatase [Steroidobacteraceae bacterium]
MHRIIDSLQSSVSISEQSDVGECRRRAMRMAEQYAFDETQVGRIGIVATEVANNIFRHAGGGTVLTQVLDDSIQPVFEIVGIDQGPGMADVRACLRDGHSTAGTAGTGLGAISRLSTVFDIYSIPGKGTAVLSRIIGRAPDTHPASPVPAKLELGVVCLALAGEIECGDSWSIADNGEAISIMIADGLGHGPLAASASKAAVAAFVLNPFDRPEAAMRSMHKAASGTRGTAAACATLNIAELTVEYAGVGNISGAVVNEGRTRGMVSHNGTLGLQLLRTQQFQYPWPVGSYVVMHSDGVSSRWSLADYPGLTRCHAAVIAAVLYRDFARERDDVTVIVARQ